MVLSILHVLRHSIFVDWYGGWGTFEPDFHCFGRDDCCFGNRFLLIIFFLFIFWKIGIFWVFDFFFEKLLFFVKILIAPIKLMTGRRKSFFIFLIMMSCCCFLLFFFSVPKDCEGICKERILILLLTTVKLLKFRYIYSIYKKKKGFKIWNINFCWCFSDIYLRNFPNKHEN